MSMGSWYIIVTKLFEQTKLFALAKAAQQTFWAANSVQEGLAARRASTGSATSTSSAT